MPITNPFECGSFGDIEDVDDTMGVFEVRRDEAAVPFLPGCVPHLQTIDMAVAVEVLDVEINTNGVLV